MKQTLAQHLMSEYINLGGQIMTRAQAVEMLRRDGCSEQCIDITVFGQRAVALDMSNIEDPQVQARLLAVSEQCNREDRDAAEFYDLMAEAQ
jgi:hypothetical protein